MIARVPSTDGVTVAVHDLGTPSEDAPVLLLAHANGFCGECYAPMVTAGLSARFRCLALDLRGHGDSEVPDGLDYQWEGFGRDVLAVLDAFDIGSEVGVLGFGHSLGGAALVMAEAARPGSFDGLFLFEPIIPPPLLASEMGGGENPMAAGAERRREVFESFDSAYENYAAKPPLDVFTPEALRAYVEGGFAEQPDGTVRLRCRATTEAQIFRMGGSHRTFDLLAKVDCPVTVAVGEPMEMGPAAFAPMVVDALPDGRLLRLPDIGHFAPMEAPADLAAALLETLLP